MYDLPELCVEMESSRGWEAGLRLQGTQHFGDFLEQAEARPDSGSLQQLFGCSLQGPQASTRLEAAPSRGTDH